jgi:hypothetical protein
MLDYGDFVVASYEGGTAARLGFDAHIEVRSEASSFTLRYETAYICHLPTHLAVHAKGSIHAGARLPPPGHLLRN